MKIATHLEPMASLPPVSILRAFLALQMSGVAARATNECRPCIVLISARKTLLEGAKVRAAIAPHQLIQHAIHHGEPRLHRLILPRVRWV